MKRAYYRVILKSIAWLAEHEDNDKWAGETREMLARWCKQACERALTVPRPDMEAELETQKARMWKYKPKKINVPEAVIETAVETELTADEINQMRAVLAAEINAEEEDKGGDGTEGTAAGKTRH